MSQQNSNSSSNNIPVSEVYWTLVAKADKKFSKIRDLPYYQRNRYDTYFYKVFKVYTQLWKFQQENRQKLVEAGLKRWEIGDIASRIGQLYFGQYMRTSEASYLSESYIFYEAVLTREYFKDGMFQDVNLSNKQLRFLARFMTVCLVLNRHDMVFQLVNQLKMLLDECKRAFQETDFKEWKLVVQEIVKFRKAYPAFMHIKPLRYSIILDLHPDCLPQVVEAKRKLRLRDALLCSYHSNEVKYSELTLDTLRMLQCLEWEPSGSFYQTGGVPPSGVGTGIGQNGAPGPSRVNYSQDISDPTLPPNPRKSILYRPSVTNYLAVLATNCEELSHDGVLLLYLSAAGSSQNSFSSPSHGAGRSFMSRVGDSEASSTSSLNFEFEIANPTSAKGNCLSEQSSCLYIGSRSSGGLNGIYPCDLLPFTRRPLFLVIDSDISKSFTDMYDKADKLLSSSLNEWGLLLAASDNLNPVWAQTLGDPFLRRLILRFIFCRTVLALYAPTFNKTEFLPECIPSLPDAFLPTSDTCQRIVLQLADIFGATSKFNFSEETTMLSECRSQEN
ncbi:hypothetical protein H5410_012428 [Solanum commersonii]|uniref:Protein SCAI n=1 Tax=Solanum commersonii TaxID=4109 RepID=A0A9J6ASL4_SOLCO|nr:hypothetical protein H5410_012428 [Solanum commersonii]